MTPHRARQLVVRRMRWYTAWLDGAMKIDDNLFMEAAAQGQTMFASAGDTGSSCALAPTNGVPASGPPLVSYPASAPYVVAVGGTTVVANADGTYSGEAAWNAGGGGVSQFENGMTWAASVRLPRAPGSLPRTCAASRHRDGRRLRIRRLQRLFAEPARRRKLQHRLRGRRHERSLTAGDVVFGGVGRRCSAHALRLHGERHPPIEPPTFSRRRRRQQATRRWAGSPGSSPARTARTPRYRAMTTPPASAHWISR